MATRRAVGVVLLIRLKHDWEVHIVKKYSSQENLFQLNSHLESLVEARTLEVKNQNKRLINYAYSNAHHVRGPVARVLGLIQLAKIDVGLDYPFLFQKIEEQTLEIDNVVRSINRELEF